MRVPHQKKRVHCPGVGGLRPRRLRKVGLVDDTPPVTLQCIKDTFGKQWRIICVPNSGATASTIRSDIVKKHGLPINRNEEVTLTDAAG